jgi:protease-4
MIFARKVWKLLVAIKDGPSLVFLLLFFGLLYGVLTARPNVAQVREGALLLRLDGAIVEEPEVSNPLQALVSAQVPASQYAARDLVRALRLAAKDERIKAVVFDLSRFTGAGAVHLADIGQAIDTVRAAKKPVLVYATAYADDGVQIAAHASEVWVNPLGGAFVIGPGGNNLYYARLLEKLKVTAHVFRVGTFKSAVEPYLRNDQSPESREASTAVYAALFEAWKADVAKARPKANLALVTTDPVGWLRSAGGDPARAAVSAGLVDRIGDEAQFGARVAQLAGKDPILKAPGAFAHTSLRTWLAAHPAKTGGKAIGVVTIAGEIVDGDAGPGSAAGDRIAGLLDSALDKDLAALVVRVDSPGGSVVASEQIRTAILRHKAKGIPVVVSMANLAASGGYWVATPATRIFAEPATITGSIGIFAVIPTFERTLADWGVNADGVKTTPLSGQPDVLGGLNPEISGMLQAMIESNYARFLGLVGQARGKSPAEVDRIAQGRVWDGGTARQLGLVDQFGSLDDAIAYAASAAKLRDGGWHARYLGSKPEPWMTLLQQLRKDDEESAPPTGTGRDWAAMVADRQQAQLMRALGDGQRLLGARGAQALCLECRDPDAPTSGSAVPSGWIALLEQALAR